MSQVNVVGFVTLTLAAGAAGAQTPPAADASGCPAVTHEEAALIAEEGNVGYHLKLDKDWFKCAREKGALSVEFVLQAGTAERPAKTDTARSSNIDLSLARSQICLSDFATEKVYAKLTGTGPFASLTRTFEPVEFFCPKCSYPSYNTFIGVLPVIKVGGSKEDALRPVRSANVEAKVSVDDTWRKCASKLGGGYEMLFYAGETPNEVAESLEPLHVLPKLEKKKDNKVTFPLAKLCGNEPTKRLYYGYELRGTGEFKALHGTGRAKGVLNCPVDGKLPNELRVK